MFWDYAAYVYDLFAKGINRKCHKTLCKKMEGYMHEEDEVLECACGTGMLTKHMALYCKYVTATDYSLNMVKKAEKNCRDLKNVFYQCVDLNSLPYENDSFDTVVAANVIHLLPDPDMAFNEMVRVCRNGGRLIIPTYVNQEKSGKDNLFSRILGKAGAGFKRQFSFASYQEFIHSHGFEDVKFDCCGGFMPCAIAVIEIGKDF